MVNAPPKQPTPPKLSKLEGIKERSHHLRHPLIAELQTDARNLPEEAIQILKFHGSYQQDNRDNRAKGQEKDYQFMLRTRSPGGFIPAQLYKTLDELSETYGNQTLRATTRQGFQIHGIVKQNLKTVMAAIIHSMGSTLGACGDLNRNVMAPPAPYVNRPDYVYAQEYANRIADLLTPQTGAYYEIWLDGEKFLSAEEHPEVKAARQRNTNGTNLDDDEEPIYGQHYMPRKFKIAVTVPGDNSIDLYTQDVGLVVILDDQDELQGFNVFVGGGMGRTHKKEETFARIADPLGFVAKEDVYDLVKAIVATQRDYGDRQQRRHARMKYLVNDWGIDKFRSVVEQYFGKSVAPSRPLPEFKYEDYLGWHEQGDGQLFLGISIENGRVFDNGKLQLKSALRQITKQYHLPMRLTANHNLIIYNIQPSDKAAIQGILNHAGVLAETEIDPLVRYAMACPALPTCGLAIAESERAIPGIIDRIRALLNKLDLKEEHFVIRMTGCPNGCARPYMAELGFVGIKPTSYQLWLGGSPNQTRLARTFLEVMPIDELETTLEPLLVFFKQKGKTAESFGDFCDRIGFDALRQYSDTYDPATQTGKIASGKARVRHRVNLREDVYSRLKETASAQGKTLTEVASDAIDTYLKNQSQT
ncbi:sulfite reductase, ferredoxin dependent [Acaryochloris sp. CCMEE 5410]|uniref:sulfite reductase, ferredoxin dependent n=1 Tax=Acaryochloris sp. CCMEE 5410 TaxID=310037 RepID=UPI0002484E17|nr:sulfite reductase, ferredoxin dependent [Acaryochloris sp. CCMEE 5410]KAI9133865.1 sulfite reductase, ferredoxin dependent [Acaryochloris sp. CCMEE 5410]